MRNITFWSGFGFALFTLLAIVSILISVVTFTSYNLSQDGFFGFLAVNHLWIMLITIFLSIGYGFSWAYFLQKKVEKQEDTSKNILDIVVSFLSLEERDVLKHLVKSDGETTQARISHIKDMGGVKALRTVQKMQEKNLVAVEKHGKMRKIILNEEILQTLKEKPL